MSVVNLDIGGEGSRWLLRCTACEKVRLPTENEYDLIHKTRVSYNGYYLCLPSTRREFDSRYPLQTRKNMTFEITDLMRLEVKENETLLIRVDVGNMPRKEAEEYLSKIGAYDKKSYLEKVVEGIGVAGSFGGFNVN